MTSRYFGPVIHLSPAATPGVGGRERDTTALPSQTMPHTSHSSNLLLASLPPENRAALVPHLRVVELSQETVLFEAGDTIKAIYFPHTGIVSIVVDLASGDMIETAMIGRDSLVGGSAAVDDDIALNRAVVQVAFRGLAQQSHTFHATLARHRQFILAQAQQSAACNATHTLEARLSRWLLRCHDLLGSDDIPLTQEFLAGMLGARRTSVTLVAGTLQRAGFIHYQRGHIRVTDLEGLQESACECYETIKAQGKRLLGNPAERVNG
jgi:CRP-like cAMP-binding protein